MAHPYFFWTSTGYITLIIIRRHFHGQSLYPPHHDFRLLPPRQAYWVHHYLKVSVEVPSDVIDCAIDYHHHHQKRRKLGPAVASISTASALSTPRSPEVMPRHCFAHDHWLRGLISHFSSCRPLGRQTWPRGHLATSTIHCCRGWMNSHPYFR